MTLERDRVSAPGQCGEGSRGGWRARSALIVVGIIAFATLVAASCGPARGRDPEVLVIEETEQTASFIRNFNPLLEAGDVRYPARRAMYEPLLIFEPLRGDYVPRLAERYTWLDGGHRLRFDLRRGVRWSDGAPFSARDVVFTFGLLKKFPALDTRGVHAFVAEVRAVDDYTVEFALSRVYVPGLFYIGQQPLVPQHVWQSIADPVSFANPNPVGSGPFTEVQSFETQAYQIGRNPNYWQPGKPAVKAIRFMALPSNDQATLAILRSEVDWAGSFLPAVERIYVERDREHHHYWFPPIDGTVMLYANTTRAPLDDVRVRKALSMAIDRALLVKIAMHDYTRPSDATALSDAYTRYRSAEAVARGTWVQHDRAGAEALLDEAGLRRGPDGVRRMPDGKPLSLAIGVAVGWSDWVRAAQVISRGLREVGIDASVETSDYNAWYERLQQGTFQLSLGWTEVNPSPYGLYRHMMSAETKRPVGEMAAENWHRFASPAADALLTELEVTTDSAREHALCDQLQMIFVDNAPAIPLFPGPLWGEFSTRHFVGFPDAEHPYAPVSPHALPQAMLVLTELRPAPRATATTPVRSADRTAEGAR
jgi:peptide/nickel transport system substrate-binding protein